MGWFGLHGMSAEAETPRGGRRAFFLRRRTGFSARHLGGLARGTTPRFALYSLDLPFLSGDGVGRGGGVDGCEGHPALSLDVDFVAGGSGRDWET